MHGTYGVDMLVAGGRRRPSRSGTCRRRSAPRPSAVRAATRSSLVERGLHDHAAATVLADDLFGAAAFAGADLTGRRRRRLRDLARASHPSRSPAITGPCPWSCAFGCGRRVGPAARRCQRVAVRMAVGRRSRPRPASSRGRMPSRCGSPRLELLATAAQPAISATARDRRGDLREAAADRHVRAGPVERVAEQQREAARGTATQMPPKNSACGKPERSKIPSASRRASGRRRGAPRRRRCRPTSPPRRARPSRCRACARRRSPSPPWFAHVVQERVQRAHVRS